MPRSRRPGLLGSDPTKPPTRTPGLLGVNDAADPSWRARGVVGDTPGLTGFNDWGDPSLALATKGLAGGLRETVASCTDYVEVPAINRDPGLEDTYYTYEDAGWMNYARRGVVNTLLDFATSWRLLHPSYPIGIGDLSANGGAGNFNRHPGSGHAGGRTADLRPMVLDSIVYHGAASGRTSVGAANYNASLTYELVERLLGTGQVEYILFNDKEIRKAFPNLVRYADGHSNHLHVVFKTTAGCGAGN